MTGPALAPRVEARPKAPAARSAARRPAPAARHEPRAPERRGPDVLPAFARSAPATPSPTRAHVAVASPEGGAPLDSAQRLHLESRFRRDFSDVRVHPRATDHVQRLATGAQAVTVGSNVFVRDGASLRSAEGEALLVHELTHVAQQAGAAGTPPATPTLRPAHDVQEAEARQNVIDFRSGRPLNAAQPTPEARPQGEEQQDHGWFYELVVRAVPALRPILDRGVFNWIGDRLGDVAASIMESIRAPLDTLRGIEGSIADHVTRLIEWVKKCIAALAKGDCSVLHEGIEYIEHAIQGITGPALDLLKAAFEKVSRFFNGLWERYGAPLWSKIKDFAGAAWQKIEQFFSWVREKIQPIIDRVLVGWNRVKTWLGIGDDPDAQNGLLPWAQRKLEALWESIKARLEPIKRPLLIAAGILVMLSPAGPFIAIGLAIGGVIEAIRWIRRTFAVPNGVVSARQLLKDVILPRMISAITGLAQALADKARFIVSKLLLLKQNLDEAAAAVAASIFDFLAGPIQFVGGLVTRVVDWANEKLGEFVTWVHDASTRFASFLVSIVDVLNEISHVIIDLLRIPLLLAGRLWNRIPACIRDPFVEFLGVQILGRLPIFQSIAGTPEAWARTQQEVRAIIRSIFVDYDLVGAMKRAFRLLLTVLNVPMELLTAVLAKMDQAWDVIKARPVQFLKNLWRTLALALRGFFSRILTHLGHGIVGWITAQLEGTGVMLPRDWTDFGEIFRFVASVLGLSLDHVFTLMEQRIPREVVQRIRQVVNVLSGAWEWVVLIARGDFNAFWQRIRERINDIRNTIISGVRTWIMENVVGAIAAQLVTTADPTGISEAIMLIVDLYRTIKTVVQYMRRILEMVERMLDAVLNIAAGTLQPAADLVEEAFDRAMPVVIGFLANLAGFGNLGEQIRTVIGSIRERVDAAILWLIDRAKQAVDFLISLAQRAGAAIAQWWSGREKFKTDDDDKEHTLYFRGEGENAQLMVASNPDVLEAFLNGLKPSTKATYATQITNIITHRDAIYAIKARVGGAFGVADGQLISGHFRAIATELKAMKQPVPDTVITYDAPQTINVLGSGVPGSGGSESLPTGVTAEPLSTNPGSGNTAGSVPRDRSLLFESVNRRPYQYKRGHLLNHHLFGPGTKENLIPISTSLNGIMANGIENEGKKLVLDENKVVSYRVKVNWAGGHPARASSALPDEQFLPVSLDMAIYDTKAGPGGTRVADMTKKPLFGPVTAGHNLPPLLPPGSPLNTPRAELNLDACTVSLLQSFADPTERIGRYFRQFPTVAQKIEDKIGADGTKLSKYRSYEDLPVNDGIRALLRDDPYVKLYAGATK